MTSRNSANVSICAKVVLTQVAMKVPSRAAISAADHGLWNSSANTILVDDGISTTQNGNGHPFIEVQRKLSMNTVKICAARHTMT